MKLASKFAPRCPRCRRPLPRATFGLGYDMPWDCLGCVGRVCTWCYAEHTAECCPDLNVVPSRHPPGE